MESAGTSARRAQLPGRTPSREAEHDGAGRGQRGSRDARPGSASTRDPRVTGSGAAASSDRGGRGGPVVLRSPPPPPWPGPSTRCSWPGLCWSPVPSTHYRQSESGPGREGRGLCPACRSPRGSCRLPRTFLDLPPSQISFPGFTRSTIFCGRFTRFMEHPRGARPREIQSESVPGLGDSNPGFDLLCA